MKIVFIEPKAPGPHIFSKWPMPRLGTIILGTILKKAGHEVKVFIEEIAKINWDEVYKADAVGISAITPTAPRAYFYALHISKKGIPVILGGPHPSALPDEALKYARYVARGEGEEVILPLLEAIEYGRGFENIQGLSFKLNPFSMTLHNPLPDNWCDINKIPIPDFSLIEGWKGDNITPIQTSRGCPYNCKFCSVTRTFGRQMRYKTLERVIAEIRSQNSEYIFFCDDNFAASKERTKKLLRKVIGEGLKIKWGAQIRVDAARDEELVALMKDAGCFMVYIGMESINPDSLKDARKKQTVDDIVRGIRVFHRYGIKIHGMFVVGFDTDEIKTIRQTAKFAIKERIDSIQIMMLTPLPGTETYEQLKQEGRLLPEIGWEKYDAHHVVFRSRIFPDRLQIETMRAMAKFYSWRQVLKQVFKMNWWGAAIKSYGNRLTKRWQNEIKRDFLKKLKSLSEKLGAKD